MADNAKFMARADLEEYKENVGRIALAVGLATLLVLAVALTLLGLARQARGGGRSTPYLATGLGLLSLLFLVGIIGTVHLNNARMNEPEVADPWQQAWKEQRQIEGLEGAPPMEKADAAPIPM